MSETQLYVHVAPIADGRQIGWGSDVIASLQSRAGDIGQAVQAGLSIIADTLTAENSPSVPGWALHEITTSFGVTVTSEGGVIFAKASAETAFEVTATFQRVRAATPTSE